MLERVVSSEEQLIRINDKNVITNRRISLNLYKLNNIYLKVTQQNHLIKVFDHFKAECCHVFSSDLYRLYFQEI
jgi:hypothetical protein